MHKSGTTLNFDWDEYYILAQELAGNKSFKSKEDAKLRSSTSRVYYSAFCQVRNHLKNVENVRFPENINVHEFVINKFRKSKVNIRKQLGINLARLRDNRNKADYDEKIPGSLKSMTKTSIQFAEKIQSQLGQL